MKKSNIVRLPRPMGITEIMAEYHKCSDPVLLDKVQTLLIQKWLLSNGSIFGRVFDTYAFSKFILCEPSKIQNQMRDQVLNNRIWDMGMQTQMMESLIGQQIMWAMEDRMEINHQVQVLREAQGDRYMPFISAELNKALGLKLSSSNSLQSLVKGLSGGGSVNIFTQINQQNNNQPQGVTIEEAMVIIQEENHKVIDKSKEIQYIEATYGIDELPEVVASKQQGIDTSKEGLTLNQAQLISIADNYKGTLNELKELDHHETRREIEHNIDLEQEDPELSSYEEAIEV